MVSWHNQRGQAENYIKELLSGFGMEWMPCGETYANAVFFRIGVLAYNLFLAMKLLALPPSFFEGPYLHHLHGAVEAVSSGWGIGKACPPGIA